jgi:hypothetical protein
MHINKGAGKQLNRVCSVGAQGLGQFVIKLVHSVAAGGERFAWSLCELDPEVMTGYSNDIYMRTLKSKMVGKGKTNIISEGC